MGMFCKKHGKRKTEYWLEKQARGGGLMRIGCVDCKEAARGAPPRRKDPNPTGNPFTMRREV
jgi:hypothetical protein